MWLIFIAATLACGAFIGFGKAPMLTCRFGTMALVVIRGGNRVADACGMVCLAFAPTVLARLIDHLIAGRCRDCAPCRSDADRRQVAGRATSYVRIAERVVGTVVSVVAA